MEKSTMVKIQIKSIFGSVLFEYEKENNTIKETLQEAVKKGTNLEGAYLGGAYLEGAYLGGAYLGGAYLEGAYLRGAYLEGANLRGANLEGAYLEGAYLGGAYLEGAYLRGAYLEGAYLEGAYLRGAYLEGAYLEGANLRGAVKIPIYCKWSVGITDGKIHIGCEKRTIEEWDVFFTGAEELSTKRGTPEFKQIEATYLAYKAYYQHLNK
jgi:uncharacterized protein YjbI with pentapeptide repeats